MGIINLCIISTIIMASRFGPEAAERPQNITLPLSCMTEGTVFFCVEICVWFTSQQTPVFQTV